MARVNNHTKGMAYTVGRRVAYGALAIVVLVTLVELDTSVAAAAEQAEDAWGSLIRRGSVLPAFLLLIVLRGASELARLLRSKGGRPYVLFASVMIGILLLTPWLSAAGWLGQGPAELEGFYWQVIWLFTSMVGVCILAVLRGRPDEALRDIGGTLTMILYLGFLGSFALQLRSSRDVPGQEGAWLLLIAILVTKASDIGAYFGGTAFGRHKLAPLISPGKSVEGMAAGLLAGAGAGLLFSLAGPIATALRLDPQVCAQVDSITRSFSLVHTPGGMSPLWRALFFGIALSAAGQIGDLVESCFKRDAGIKDSGNIMPHYGGILDMIDSPILAIPVAWFLLTVVWNVV